MQQEYVFTRPFVEKQTKTTKMKTKTSQMESLDCQKPNNKTFKRKKTIEALAERGMGAFFVFVCFVLQLRLEGGERVRFVEMGVACLTCPKPFSISVPSVFCRFDQ